jgi:hypothetical protein
MTMTDTDRMPQVLADVLNVGRRGYTLTEAQKMRRRRGQSIYERDRKVEDYKYSKGEWV